MNKNKKHVSGINKNFSQKLVLALLTMLAVFSLSCKPSVLKASASTEDSADGTSKGTWDKSKWDAARWAD